MALDSKDDIVVKLSVKGVDPSEAKRLADSSAGQIEQELRASLQRQQEAYANAARVMSAQGQAYAKQEIAEAQNRTKQLQAAYQMQTAAAKQADAEIQKMGKAQAAAMVENAAREKTAIEEKDRALREHIETMRAVTETAAIWYEAIKGGYEKLKQFGEEVIRTSKVFASLRGEGGAELKQQGFITSIFGGPEELQSARAATEDVVSDMDLIMAKNRAAQLDLDLTGPQFAKVAKAAEVFASAVGIDTGEALNQLSTGLATGNAKLLKHAGILVDAATADQKWARENGNMSVDVMNSAQKLQAFQEEAFTKIDKKLEESGDKAQTFGKTLEQAFIGVKNVYDRTLAVIGNAKMFDAMADQDVQSEVAGDNSPLEQQKRARNRAIMEARQARLKQADAARAAKIDQAGKDAGLAANGGELPGENTFSGDVDAFGNTIALADSKDVVGSHAQHGKVQISAMQRLLAGFKHSAPMDQAAEDAATDIHDAMQKALENVFDSKSLFTPEEQAKILSKPWEKLPDKTMGVDFLRQIGWDVPEDAGQSDEDAKFEGEMKKRLEAADKVLSDNKDKNAKKGGWLSFTLGDDFLAKSQAEMSELERATLNFTGEMSNTLKGAGDAMAGAMGHAMAAAIGENKNFKDVLKDTTHAVLMSLSEQALAKAAFETALGLAALAGIITAGDAAPHFAAAAAFGAVGVAAGVGARATYSAPTSAGSTPTESRPSSSSGSSAQSGSGDGRSITININAPLGDPVAVGRAMDEAFQRYRQQTGREIGARP